MAQKYDIEFDREEDGRWIAGIKSLPGVMAYGRNQALARVEALSGQMKGSRL